MPKTKKNKATKIFNWLKPTSPAKSAMLFAIVFGVIGGGYALYRSFALSLPAHLLVNNVSKIGLAGGTGIKHTDSQGGLPDTYVWRIDNVTGGTTLGTSFYLYALSTSIDARFCVTYRFSNGTTGNNLYLWVQDPNSINTLAGVSIVNQTGGTTYKNLCTQIQKISLNYGVYNRFRTYVIFDNPKDGSSSYHAYIQNMSMAW